MTEIIAQPKFNSGCMDRAKALTTLSDMPRRGPYGMSDAQVAGAAARRVTNARKWRKVLGYTQEEAAEGADVSTGTISALERGASDYVQDSLEKIAKFYKIPAGWLIDIDPTTDDLWLLLRKATKLQKGTISDFAKRILNPKD